MNTAYDADQQLYNECRYLAHSLKKLAAFFEEAASNPSIEGCVVLENALNAQETVNRFIKWYNSDSPKVFTFEEFERHNSERF